LGGGVRVDRSTDAPQLLTPAQAAEIEGRFERFRALASAAGNPERGRQVFAQACASCHSVQGQGGQIGPSLNGAGAMGLEALLRSIVTPNAMMESGYRRFHVEKADGEAVEGFLVSDAAGELTVRPIAGGDVRIPSGAVRRAYYSRTSLMPEGLLEALETGQVTDLFAYLKELK
jgi:putative heme-binding domain-containing protein